MVKRKERATSTSGNGRERRKKKETLVTQHEPRGGTKSTVIIDDILYFL